MKMRVKNDGSILLPTLIISGMILSLALALTKIVSSEIQFSADLLLAERSYYAAESGVEKSLLWLKDEPLNWVEETIDLANTSTADVFIENSKPGFEFSLDPKSALRWQLGVDTDSTRSINEENDISLVKEFSIKLDDDTLAPNLQWKIQCDAGDNKTEMLQARAAEEGAETELIDTTFEGTYDGDTNTAETLAINEFLYLSIFDAYTLCYITLTNFGDNDVISGTVTTTSLDKMAPAQTRIRAIGKAGGREKIIEFEYRQKNLNPFFDFGLLHKNKLIEELTE